MLNNISLVGRITKDPQLRHSTSNKPFVGFTLAVNGMNPQQADFIPCYAWNKTAENMAKYLKKGSLIAIEGRIASTTRDRRDVIFVNVVRLTFLEKKSSASPINDDVINLQNEGLDAMAPMPENSNNINNKSQNQPSTNSNAEPDNSYSANFFDDDDDIKWE